MKLTSSTRGSLKLRHLAVEPDLISFFALTHYQQSSVSGFNLRGFICPSPPRQGSPLPSPDLFTGSRWPTSVLPTPPPPCLSLTGVSSPLRSAAAAWTPAWQPKLRPVCWREVHCGKCPTEAGRRESERTSRRDRRGTNQAPPTPVRHLLGSSVSCRLVEGTRCFSSCLCFT